MEEVPKFCPQHPNWFVKKPKNIDLHSRVLFWTKRRYDRTGQTIICEKCGEPGHLFALCPNPREMRCILCGDFNHNHENCPEAEFNDNIKYNAENCKYCGQPNHQGEKCPDHWRQFHRTTSENFQEPDNRKSSKKPSCYNCSGEHWGHHCPKKLPDSHAPVSAPFVSTRIVEDQSNIFDRQSQSMIHRECFLHSLYIKPRETNSRNKGYDPNRLSS